MDSPELLASFKSLPEQEQKEVAAAIAEARPLPGPTGWVVGALWLMVVGAFVLPLLGGGILLYLLTVDDKSTEVIDPPRNRRARGSGRFTCT